MGRKAAKKSARKAVANVRRGRRLSAVIVGAGFLGGALLAVLALRSGEPGGGTASPEARSALDGDPDMRRGEEAYNAARIREAKKFFTAAAQRHPDRPEPLLRLSMVYRVVRQGADAIATARRACDVAPKNAACQVALGKAFEAAGERDQATVAYSRARTLDPHDPEPPFRLGLIAAGKLQTEVATGFYREALAADPGYAPATHYLASQLTNRGDFETAEQLLKTALARDPGHPDLRLNLALTYLRKGDAARAVTEFQTALRSVPGKPEPYFHLGSALTQLGRDEHGNGLG